MIVGVWFIRSVVKADDPVGAGCRSRHLRRLGSLGRGHIRGRQQRRDPDCSTAMPSSLFRRSSGLLVAVAWGLGAGLILFKAIDLTMGLRASDEEEAEGLDEPEHGAVAYAELAD